MSRKGTINNQSEREGRTYLFKNKSHGYLIPWIICFLLSLFVLSVYAGWNVENIGTCEGGRLEEIAVADARNDGVKRIYVATRRGYIFEWTYSGTEWISKDIYKEVQWLTPLAIGPGRNDGVNRIYTGEYDASNGKFREVSFSDTSWVGESIDTIGSILCAKLYAGRNDTINRLYAGGYPFAFTEYSWNGNGWDELAIDTPLITGTMDFGNGRNDKTNRLYVPDRQGKVYEFTWNGSSYDKLIINTPERIVAAALGDAHNDGINRLYAAKDSGHIYEVTYTNGWGAAKDITPQGPDKSHYGLIVAKTRRDSKERIYATSQGGAVYEYSYNGNNFEDTILVDAVSGATACITVGAGRNDDTTRIYATNYEDGHIYEITNTDPWVEQGTHISEYYTPVPLAKPDLFINGLSIEFQLNGTVSQNVSLEIYDIHGRIVGTLLDKLMKAGTYTLLWDRTNNNGRGVASGVFVCRLKYGKFEVFRKMVVRLQE